MYVICKIIIALVRFSKYLNWKEFPNNSAFSAFKRHQETAIEFADNFRQLLEEWMDNFVQIHSNSLAKGERGCQGTLDHWY